MCSLLLTWLKQSTAMLQACPGWLVPTRWFDSSRVTVDYTARDDWTQIAPPFGAAHPCQRLVVVTLVHTVMLARTAMKD
jgi:hypothetical protein